MPTQPDYARRYTVEEYFALEAASLGRHEYYHGEIFPLDAPANMAGGNKRHNLLIQNCVVALRGGHCEAGAAQYLPKTCGWPWTKTSTTTTPMWS